MRVRWDAHSIPHEQFECEACGHVEPIYERKDEA